MLCSLTREKRRQILAYASWLNKHCRLDTFLQKWFKTPLHHHRKMTLDLSCLFMSKRRKGSTWNLTCVSAASSLRVACVSVACKSTGSKLSACIILYQAEASNWSLKGKTILSTQLHGRDPGSIREYHSRPQNTGLRPQSLFPWCNFAFTF